MTTDKQIYLLFQAVPNWVFELTGLESPGRCSLQSVTVKALQRSADGVIVPTASAQPITILEIQFQKEATVYTRIVTEMALIQEAHAMRAVQGIVIFRDRNLDPKTEPWNAVVKAFYLDELLEHLARSQPHHPLVAVFGPIFAADEAALERDASGYYRDIRNSAVGEGLKTTLSDIFLNWVLQRFTGKTLKEIETMVLVDLTPLEETTAGKELIQIGIERAIVILLQSRFQTVPEKIRQQVHSLDLPAAERLLQVITTLDSLQALEQWLANNNRDDGRR